MFRKDRILFAVDFSSGCQSLVPTVRRMIEYWQSEVTLLHVIEARHWPGHKPELERLMMQMRTVARALGDRHVACRVERGVAADRILQYSRANRADLIVIAARRRFRVRGSPTGSVADHVLAEAECGVWLDWDRPRPDGATGMYARRVGCALVHHDSDEFVLREAEDISGELNAGLTVVQALLPPRDQPLVLLRERRVRDAALAMIRKRIESLRRSFYPPADITVQVGSHRGVVGQVIESQGMGLLVTGNHREVILAAESKCPVLRVAPPAAAAAANPRDMMAARSCA